MANSLFCSAEFIKNNSSTNIELSDKKIVNAISLSMDKFLEPVLGSGIFNELQDQINTTGDTLSTNNRTLLTEKIKPALLWFTVFELYGGLRSRLNESGVMIYETENQKAISADEFESRRTEAKNNGEMYASKLRDYLIANPTKYPLYNNPGSSYDTVHPEESTYDGGLFLPDHEVNGRVYDKLGNMRWM